MSDQDKYPVVMVNRQKTVSLPQYFWYDREPLTLTFPEDWEVCVCEMNGDVSPILGMERLKHKVFSPIGSLSLPELAKDKKEVAIVVDDLSRPTEASLIVPFLLQTLSELYIPKESIRFLIALGCHGAHTAEDFRKKLGAHVVEQYGVYNHNCYENCIEIGATRSGIPLKINAELMKCDLKIGVGSMLPHSYTGYSGGGKLFLPGMAHIDTIDRFHSFLTPSEKGKIDHDNPMIGEIEDALKLIGVDYKIDVLVNTKGEIIDLFAGDATRTYQKGIFKAESVYKTDAVDDFDVVISNAHLKANEGDIALLIGFESVRQESGICILIVNSPSGQMPHYLMRRFGKFTGGRQSETRVRIPDGIKVIVFSQYKDTTTFDPFENQEIIIWESDWSRVIRQIQDHFGDRKIKIGIIPDGTIQYRETSDHDSHYKE